jgi:hypothetical protein
MKKTPTAKTKSVRNRFKFFPRKAGVSRGMMAVAAAVVLTIGGVGYYASTQLSNRAQASSSRQYCIKSLSGLACLNAWNGGPYVNVYQHTGAINNYFWWHKAYNGHYMLTATGTYNTRWNGQCIGDASNNPSFYDTSLDQCPSTLTSAGGGWGTNFYPPVNCSNAYGSGIAFRNVHTGYYLAPGDYQNGAAWNLGGTGPASDYCFTTYL